MANDNRPTCIINVADLKCPSDPQGRTYRQINAAKTHSFPIGALVELETGVRMFIVHHGRDCDMTPLYWLSARQNDTEQNRPGFANYGWYGGVDEGGMKLISTEAPDAR